MLDKATDRPFGIELEYSYPRYRLPEIRTRINAKLEELGQPQATWGIGIDGGEYGVEVRTPPSTWANWPVIEEIVRMLRPMGRAQNSCGTHLHLDTSDFGHRAQEKLVALWYALEPVFFRLVPHSRRENWACSSVRDSLTWSDVRTCALHGVDVGLIDALYGDRYAYVPDTYHGTVEIRLHSCTMSVTKLKNWVYLFQAFTNHGQSMEVTQIGRVNSLSLENKFKFMEEMLHAQLPERRAGSVYKYYCARREALR